MLEQAKLKDVYYKLEKIHLGQKDFLNTLPPQHRNKYDFVVASGLINNNYCDENLFQQMMICCKNNGYLIFAARYSYLGDYWYSDRIRKYEKKGRIRAVEEEAFFKYDGLMEAVGKFSKTPSKVYVFQKTEEDSILYG